MPTNPANVLLSPIRQLWHRHWLLILIIMALVVVLIWGLALLQPERFSDDVWTLHLRDCDLDYHIPIRSIALACPRMERLYTNVVEHRAPTSRLITNQRHCLKMNTDTVPKPHHLP